MKGFTRFVTAAYTATICLIAINIITGPGGVISYNELSNYKKTIEENIYQLKNINDDLITDSGKLIHQPEEIIIQARELGWVKDNEGIIVVDGYDKTNSGYSMGRLLSREGQNNKNRHNNLIISLITGLSVYVLSGFVVTRNLRKNS